MRIEPLGLGKALRCRSQRVQPRPIETDNRGSFQEIEDAEAGGETGTAAGRQNVTWTRYIVADRFGRVMAKENGPGVAHF